MLVRLDAAPETVREAAIRALAVAPDGDRSLVGPLFGDDSTQAYLRVEVSPSGGATTVRLEGGSKLQLPYFGWFVRLIVWFAAGRALRDAAVRLRAEVTGEPAPPPTRRARLMPTASFTSEQATRLATLAAVGVVASFGSALLTQLGDPVTRSFDKSDEALGDALAVARIGVLISLVAAALADRFGRRRMMLVCLGGVCASNAIAAAAPSFEVFTATQVFTRAFANATLVVASIATVEEAPEGARAFSFSMFGLALGAGFGCSVLLLPVADLGDETWRAVFVLSALTVVFLPGLARRLRETKRFERLGARAREKVRVFEPFDRRYGRRFVLLGLVAFLVNVFSAPSSQLTNRYLTKVHDFTNSQVALLRGVTAGLPGIIGVLLAGRLSETRGRRPVIIVGLLVASVAQMIFFLGSGVVLWLVPTVSIIAAACAGLAVGTANSELFPTEARGTSNGFLLVSGVAGAATGLLLAPRLKHLVGGLGPGIALCGIAPILAALLIVPRLPETRARTLDEISPSEL
jgi:AAHS family benzoate transporter-like MFS transporter